MDLSEVEEILRGVTPGPWRTHAVDDTAIISSDGTDVGTTCDSAKAERDDAYNNNYEQMEADARFIAWCREGVPALLAQNAALRAERDEWKDCANRNVHKLGLALQNERDAKEAAEAKVEKLRGALMVARAHVANNAEGWSVSRGAARDDLTIVDAALTTKADPAEVFNKADWFWRTMDPEDCGEEFVHFATQQEAIDAAKARAAITKEKSND